MDKDSYTKPSSRKSRLQICARKNVVIAGIIGIVIVVVALCARNYVTERQISKLEEHVVEQDHIMAAMSETDKDQKQKMAMLSETVTEQDHELAMISGTVKEQGRKIAVISETVKDQDHKMAEMSETVTGQGHKMAKISETVKEQERKMAVISETVTEQDHKIALISETLKMLENMKDKMALNISHLILMSATQEQEMHNLSSNILDTAAASQASVQELQGMIQEKNEILEVLKTNFRSIEEDNRRLDEKINQPVNIFQKCKKQTDSCSIGSVGNERYWKNCPTRFFSNSEHDYITLSKWCSYQSQNKKYSEILTVFEKDDKFRCDCDVINPGSSQSEHQEVESVNAMCILTVIRCPAIMTLFE